MSNDTETLTLSAFLLARLDEDEAAAKSHRIVDARQGIPESLWARIDGQLSTRLLADVAAKRRIVELHALHMRGLWWTCRTCYYDLDEYEYPSPMNYPCPTLRALAAPYAAHPDFREEWR